MIKGSSGNICTEQRVKKDEEIQAIKCCNFNKIFVTIKIPRDFSKEKLEN